MYCPTLFYAEVPILYVRSNVARVIEYEFTTHGSIKISKSYNLNIVYVIPDDASIGTRIYDLIVTVY